MSMGLERSLKELVAKIAGKQPQATSVEGLVQFAAENYKAATGVGPQGVGIKSITGRIDKNNKLTLTFTMTDMSTQKVEVVIN